jgi:hypothetical protein
MAAPVRGALDAVIKIVEYCIDNKDLCLFQPLGTEGVEWRFYTDSDQSSNTEINNKRRSQLSFIAMKGRAPIMFRSKVSSIKFRPDLDSFGVDHRGLSRPRCHSTMDNFHADVSSAAAEIYAALVSLNEMPAQPTICGTPRTVSMHKAQSCKRAGRINTPGLKPDGRFTLSQKLLLMLKLRCSESDAG